MPRKVEISHRTVIFTVLFLLGLWLLYQIRAVVLLVFVGMILMMALNPLVDKLERLKLPRPVAIGLIYLLLVGGMAGILAGLVPPLVEQTSKLITRLPSYLSTVGVVGIDQQILASQLSGIGSLPENILKLTVGVFSNLVGLFTLLIVTFYLLLERKRLDEYLETLLGGERHKMVAEMVTELEARLGGWVRGELVLMIVIGILVFAGLSLLKIEFALPLALLAAILEVVPNLGPVLSAVPGVLLGLSISPVTGLAVAAMYFLVHQAENALIVPTVMRRSAGVNPLITLISLIIGYELAGVVGAILAVPVVLVVSVVLSRVLGRPRLAQVASGRTSGAKA